MADPTSNPNYNPEFEWNPNITVPGVDIEALHKKYSKMAKQRDANLMESNPELLAGKSDAMLRRMEASRTKVAMGVPAGKNDKKPENAEEALNNTPMPKIDNLLICNACAGQGMRKIKYMYQVQTRNCDECDGSGLIEKVKSEPEGLSDKERWELRKSKVKDVELPETGDQEMALQKEVMEIVQRQFKGDVQKISSFFQHARAYGTCSENEEGAHQKYYGYLMDVFDKNELREFLPKLARLIKNKDRRLSLIATPLTAQMQSDKNNKGNTYRDSSGSIFKCSSGSQSAQSDGGVVCDPYTGAPMKMMEKVMHKMDPNASIEDNMKIMENELGDMGIQSPEEGDDNDVPFLE